MTIDEATRRKLSERARDALGQAEADTLMTLLPTHPLPDLATRDEIAAMIATLRAEMDQRFAAVDRQFAAVDRQFAGVDRQLAAVDRQLGELKGELKAEFARQTITLAFTLGSLIIATLGTILTLGFTGAFA